MRESDHPLSVLLDGFVVLTLIATVGAIAGLLPYAAVHRRVAYGGCLLVALAGTAAVMYQLPRLYRLERARGALSILLAEGQKLAHTIASENPGQRVDYPNRTVKHQAKYNLLAEWCSRVETVLRRDLGESYVSRFHLGGSNEQDASSMTIWKTNHRLETLASFLVELGRK